MRNWAGNHVYRARRVLEPASLPELQGMVAAADLIRAVGTRHSFNDLGDTDGDLVSLLRMPRVFEVDDPSLTVTVDAGARYGDICGPLHEAGLALDNLPSLPHITIAGACATGTHGSGDRTRVLASRTVGLDLVLADGELIHVAPGVGPVPLEAAAVSLGALGVITTVTILAEPAYRMQQEVFQGLSIEGFGEALEAATAMAESASFFTDWRGGTFDQVWLKRRVPPAGLPPPITSIGDATPARQQLHPIAGMSPEACTPQLGIPGPWHERLPHFKLSHVPSSGDELQSEYFVPRADVVPAFEALHSIRDVLAPLVQVSEIRTIASDELWLSPAFGRRSAAFHFTWLPDPAGVAAALPEVEAALAPFGVRPHWAKLSTLGPEAIRAGYPRLADFASLARQLDPTGKLTNPRLRALLDDR